MLGVSMQNTHQKSFCKPTPDKGAPCNDLNIRSRKVLRIKCNWAGREITVINECELVYNRQALGRSSISARHTQWHRVATVSSVYTSGPRIDTETVPSCPCVHGTL